MMVHLDTEHPDGAKTRNKYSITLLILFLSKLPTVSVQRLTDIQLLKNIFFLHII